MSLPEAISLEILRSIVDSTPGAVMLLDEIGTIVFMNTGARELFFEGGEPETTNFLTMLSRAPEAFKQALLADVDHIFSFGTDGQIETYHLAKRQLILG